MNSRVGECRWVCLEEISLTIFSLCRSGLHAGLNCGIVSRIRVLPKWYRPTTVSASEQLAGYYSLLTADLGAAWGDPGPSQGHFRSRQR